MDENVSALYTLLLEKTLRGALSWNPTDEGSALLAAVGSQTVKIINYRPREETSWTNDLGRQPTIVVYDNKLNVVATGGVVSQPTLNAFVAMRQSDVENISSPRLLELANLLAAKYGKPSSVQLLVETLKAS